MCVCACSCVICTALNREYAAVTPLILHCCTAVMPLLHSCHATVTPLLRLFLCYSIAGEEDTRSASPSTIRQQKLDKQVSTWPPPAPYVSRSSINLASPSTTRQQFSVNACSSAQHGCTTARLITSRLIWCHNCRWLASLSTCVAAQRRVRPSVRRSVGLLSHVHKSITIAGAALTLG